MCGIVDRVVGDGGSEAELHYDPGNELGPEKGCLGYMAVGCMVVVGSDGWDSSKLVLSRRLGANSRQ